MATNTPNLNLVKPTISENIDLATYNANLDKVDEALGAPSTEITDLLAVYNNFNTAWTTTNPTLYGITPTANANNINDLTISRQGKSVSGRYTHLSNVGYTFSGTDPVEVELPDNLWTLIGDYPLSVGTFVVINNASGANQMAGNVVIQATSGANSRLRFITAITVNAANGPWTVPFGPPASTYWFPAVQLRLRAEFFYEAP